jgi:hypothetical protein
LLLLHKAIKPDPIFFIRILALLKINEQRILHGLQWFIQCTRLVNRTVLFLKSVHPQTKRFIDASRMALFGATLKSL